MDSIEERVAEAPALAARLGEPEADARLLALLLDPEDSAVSQAAAAPLLARKDLAGLRLFDRAFGRAEQDTRNKLGDCLYDDEALWEEVHALLVGLDPDDESPDVRRGAAVLDEHMRQKERWHRR